MRRDASGKRLLPPMWVVELRTCRERRRHSEKISSKFAEKMDTTQTSVVSRLPLKYRSVNSRTLR